MRELAEMARFRIQYDWNHTAAVIAKIHNMLRGKNSPAKSPIDFHPCPPDREPTERVTPTELHGLLKF